MKFYLLENSIFYDFACSGMSGTLTKLTDMFVHDYKLPHHQSFPPHRCTCTLSKDRAGPSHPQLGPGPGSAWPWARRVRPTLALWYLVVNWIEFFKCSNFSIFVDFYVLLNSSVNSYLFMMKWNHCICIEWYKNMQRQSSTQSSNNFYVLQ